MTDTRASTLTSVCTAVAAAGMLLGLLFNSGAPATGSSSAASDRAVVATASVAVTGVAP